MSFVEEKDISNGHDNERSSSSEDLEDCPLTGEGNVFPLRRRRWLAWPTNNGPFWKFYSLFMTAISLLLLVTTIHNSASSSQCPEDEHHSSHPHSPNPLEGYPDAVDSWKKSNLIEHRFFRDLRYMSLDPDTDYLWKEHLFMATGNIQLPDGKGNTTLKGIAM